MGACFVPLRLRHLENAEDEDAIPWNLHVVEVNDCVVLVEARRKRIIESRAGILLVAAARHQSQTLGRQRHHRREGVGLVAGLQRLKAGHQQLVGHHAAGRQHLGAVNGDALAILVDDRSDELLVGLLLRRARLISLRIDDDVGQEQVVVARISEIVFQRGGPRGLIVAESPTGPCGSRPASRRRDPANARTCRNSRPPIARGRDGAAPVRS